MNKMTVSLERSQGPGETQREGINKRKPWEESISPEEGRQKDWGDKIYKRGWVKPVRLQRLTVVCPTTSFPHHQGDPYSSRRNHQGSGPTYQCLSLATVLNNTSFLTYPLVESVHADIFRFTCSWYVTSASNSTQCEKSICELEICNLSIIRWVVSSVYCSFNSFSFLTM